MQGLFTKEQLSSIVNEEKANQKERVKFPGELIRKYFPKAAGISFCSIIKKRCNLF